MTRPVKSGFYSWLEAHAQRRHIVIAALAWAALASGILALRARLSEITGGLSVPDFELFYSPQHLYALLEGYGEHGRAAYFGFSVLDVIYPIAAYGFWALLLAALTRPLSTDHRGVRAVVWLPVAGLVIELLEQGALLTLLAAFPRHMNALALLASLLTAAKYAVLTALALATMGLFLARLLRARRRPTRRSR